MPPRHHRQHSGVLRHMHGWRRAHHDPRDLVDAIPVGVVRPATVSLRGHMPPVRDQGELGSCTANAGVVIAEFVHHKETGVWPSEFSRLDLYATTRELEGAPLTEDSGCNVRDVCKALRQWGVCLETTWPYDISKFSVQPPRRAAVEGLHHRATSYLMIVGLSAIKASLAAGYPLIFGFDCFESLMSAGVAQTGFVPMPGPAEASIGGHCVTCVGYDDKAGVLELQNSWGTSWGISGFGSMPYEYVLSGLATDFVTLRRETTQ